MAQDREKRKRFIETAGDMLEDHGLSHMAGRVFGALQVCTPPHRSMDELADELRASKGSISMATRMLIGLGVIEKVSIAGHRKHYYRVRSGVWMSLLVQRAAHIKEHKELAAVGLAALEGEPAAAKERLLEMMAFFEFVEEEIPYLEERWARRYPAIRNAWVSKVAGET